MTFVNDDDMLRETRGIYVPLSTYETIFGRNSVSYMVVKAAQFERAVEAEDETKSIMNRAHNGIKDTKVTNIGKEILEEREKVDVILRNWMIVFFSIAGVSLVIGGVGILSVPKISIGLTAGLYPSLVASRLEPVEALRA